MGWDKEDGPNSSSNSGSYTKAALLAAETLRRAAAPVVVAPAPAKPEERMSVFWRLFGGTLLSIGALVCITVYQQFNSSLTDIHNELNQLTQGRAELVKEADFNTRMLSVWGAMKDLQAANAENAALKGKTSLLEQQLKASDDERKELARDFQRLRERVAALEGRQAATASVPAPVEDKESHSR